MNRHTCEGCGKRPSRFFDRDAEGFGRRWHADRTHTLCRQCYRSQMEFGNQLRRQGAADRKKNELPEQF